MSTTTASVPLRHARVWFIGLTLAAVVGMLCAAPVPHAHADTAGVSTESELADALDTSPAGRITLAADITVTSFTPTVSSDTVLDLNGFELHTGQFALEHGTTLTVDDSSAGGNGLLRAHATRGAGIRTTGATLVVAGGTVNARGGSELSYPGAGIGGGSGADAGGGAPYGAGDDGQPGGTVNVTGGVVIAEGTGGAGIGGGRGGSGNVYAGRGGGGGNVTISGGAVLAIGKYGAGIGGGMGGTGVGDVGVGYGAGGVGGSGAAITVSGGTVQAFGDRGAGIGGGAGGLSYTDDGGLGGSGATVAVSGGDVDAYGEGGAGIGGGAGGIAGNLSPVARGVGGDGGQGAHLTVTGGTVYANGTGGPGVGGGAGGAGENLGPGDDPAHFRGAAGGLGGLGIHSLGVVTASGDARAITAIHPTSPLPGFIMIDGELVLPGGQSMSVPAGRSITGSGRITGEGTIANAGIITPLVYEVGDVTVTGVNHAITFASALTGATPASRVVHVLAPSFAEGARSFPADPTASGVSFLGWAANPDGSGTPPTPTTPLSGDQTLYGVWDDESYLLAPDIPSPLVGDELTVTATAVDGDPAGDLSAAFVFTADTLDVSVTGNRLTFTTPGDWTITATHMLTGAQATLPITVGVDRTQPATIELTLSATSVDQGGSVTASVTGTDAWGNPLGDLTDLATLTSDHASDVIGPGPVIRFPTASPHVITAIIGTVTHSVAVTVVPAATGALAQSGADVADAGAAMATLLLLGGALLAMRRTHRTRA